MTTMTACCAYPMMGSLKSDAALVATSLSILVSGTEKRFSMPELRAKRDTRLSEGQIPRWSGTDSRNREGR